MICDNCSHFLVCHFDEAPDECPYFLSNDLVKVVRCKDCKHAKPDRNVYVCMGMLNPNYRFGHDFCSGGERKETE